MRSSRQLSAADSGRRQLARKRAPRPVMSNNPPYSFARLQGCCPRTPAMPPYRQSIGPVHAMPHPSHSPLTTFRVNDYNARCSEPPRSAQRWWPRCRPAFLRARICSELQSTTFLRLVRPFGVRGPPRGLVMIIARLRPHPQSTRFPPKAFRRASAASAISTAPPAISSHLSQQQHGWCFFPLSLFSFFCISFNFAEGRRFAARKFFIMRRTAAFDA